MKYSVPALLVILSLWLPTAWSEDLLMVRSSQAFPETMLTLQQTIKDYGYTVSRVQRVDIGLTAMGYETDKYRVVFYGKLDEQQRITNKFPAFIPYLPLKIAIFAEGNETLLVATNPTSFKAYYVDPQLVIQFDHWESDLRAIFEEVRNTE